MQTLGRPLAPCLLVLLAQAPAWSAEPPVIPVGLDAYRQWDKWPQQRTGMRAYMRSTYDRRGMNEGADASHFLYQLADDRNVTLDLEGSGILCFARFNHWHGSPWRYEIDGTEHIIQESSSADPDHPVADSVFLPEKPFPQPLAWTWSATKGADLNWVPMPFERSLRMSYSRTRYGTGYYIYQQFVPGTPLSRPLKSWDINAAPDADVLELINRSGSDIAPPAGAPGITSVEGKALALGKDATVLVKEIRPGGPATLRALQFSVPRDQALAFGRARLRITWDARDAASVDAPLALFHGAGTLFNRDDREYLVKAFPVSIRYTADRVYLACYFPMPFSESAKIELIGNGADDLTGIEWAARYEAGPDPAHGAYFHATYRDHVDPVRGKDLVLLNTREVEDGGDWSGHFVGSSWIFSDRANLGTLEGDPRFFFDDSQSPQAYGTGTEEWGGGGDYWGGLNMTLPFAGHPVGARNAKVAVNDDDKIESAYRFLLGDLMPFGKNARIQLEHGAVNDSTEHYRTVTYWYGRPGATLVKTDELKVSDDASEKAHRYESLEASAPYEIVSRYEWGPDTLPVQGTNGPAAGGVPETGSAGAEEIYPAHTDTGRKTTGQSEFTLKIHPANRGVMLRRKLDYQFPDQRAEVSIATADGGEWQPAGVWYLAGSNTCVHSNPKEETGATRHEAQTSNRRFRDDEFLLPRALTEDRGEIRVRVKFTPLNRPLYPGRPVDEQAWSEIRYDAYSFVAE